VNKLWSLVFGVVMLACGLSFVFAPALGWWLPEGVSSHSDEVDHLFYVILYITGFFFFLTEAILIVFLFIYAGDGGSKPARATGWPGALKPLQSVLHDSHRVEMAWTLIPAIILLYIAFAQIGTWAEVKYQRNMPEFGKSEPGKAGVPVQLDVSARQFEWRVRYPSHERFEKWLKGDKADADDFKSFAMNRQADDIELVNEVHTWNGQPTVVYLSTRDVIHSFNIPMMRVKQDALPGKVIPVWFKAKKSNATWDDARDAPVLKENWDLPCAELCGWGHYRMIGRVYVYPGQDEFLKWLRKADADAHIRSGPR
jgi:cytochrome c oxidase subunit 2